MRMILGLDKPTSGTAMDGRAYVDYPHPLRAVGALLDARAWVWASRARCSAIPAY